MSDNQRPIVHFLFEPANGGLDRVAILLANEMAARGLPAELWLSKREGLLADLISDKVTVRMVPTIGFGSRGFKLFAQTPALARMIRKYRPQAIFSAGNQSNLSIACARKLAGAQSTKIIQKITNPVVRPTMGRLRGALRAQRFRLTAALGDLCLTLSEADQRAYARMMPTVADRFRAVRNPYVTERMLETGAGRTKETGNMLLSVGRFEYQKDHATLLRALARIRDIPWHMRLLGNGSLEGELREQAVQLGIADRVSFEGFQPDPTAIYAQSDILVLSSRWEGLPAVPLEALACGCDVVTTACAEGLTDVLAPLGRDIAPIGDDAALAAGIKAALERSTRPAQGRAIAERYSISSSVDHHLELLGQL
ncbi:glycosyltransferase [Pontixanthobacter aquaemixtae]|nr:glycosyltransferase [Pontixanthobacter aquaemixtae]